MFNTIWSRSVIAAGQYKTQITNRYIRRARYSPLSYAVVTPKAFRPLYSRRQFPASVIGHGSLAVSVACLTIFLLSLVIANHPLFIDKPLSMAVSDLLGRNKVIDELMISFDTGFTFSGVVILSSLWGAWFRTGLLSERGRILLGISAAVFASLASRVLQHVFRAHLRPYYDLSFAFHNHFSDKLNTWNSFPSDHVSAFAGLCAVVWVSNAPFKYYVISWTIIVESSRLYVGAHYLSDIIGGASLGVGMVALAHRERLIFIAAQLARLAQNRTAGFYAIAFFCSYQIASLGSDIRNSLSGLKAAIIAQH